MKFLKNINIPNTLTFFRISLIPAFVLFFYLPIKWGHLIAACIFSLAAITDWVDGYLARTLKQTTKFGTFLDPVADKLMVSVALVLVVGEFKTGYIALPAAVIVGREIVISALREWMAEIGKRTSMAVSTITKTKTAVQMVALILLLLHTPSGYKIWEIIGIPLLYVAVILTLWSMVMYLKAAWPDLNVFNEQQ